MPTGGCTVDSRNVTVNLPDFPGSAEIPLGVYCSSEQKLSFYLSGATTDSARQVFANTAPDATKASGVGVSLMRNGKTLATGENVSLGTVNKSNRALICMGGNFALAMPDREASAVPLTQLDLAVHVATKLNRSHLLTARHSYILPVLGRSEIDMQKSGAQAVTVEDSMSMIHASRGVLKPAGVMLKSECAVVAGIAQAALPQSVVAWEYLVEDYDRIRNDIEAVLPEFADYNQRIRHPGGFHLINAAAERRWMTPSGKANFITSKGLLEDPSSAFNSKLVMATVRSHDQYNARNYLVEQKVMSTRYGLLFPFF